MRQGRRYLESGSFKLVSKPVGPGPEQKRGLNKFSLRGGSWVAEGGCGAAECRRPVGRIAGVPDSAAGMRWGDTIPCPLLGIPSPP